MAESADVDTLVCELFQLCVEKEQAKKLPLAEKKQGKGTTVRKILKDCLGESSATISGCEASILSKHQDKKTKKITDEKFVKDVLPELAAMKTKCKSTSEPKAVDELAKMKRKLCDKLPQMKEGPATKNAAVVDRLTDAKGYTGAHKQRFDTETGKGKGLEGREDKVDGSGYVGAYKGAGTFDCKKN